MRKNWTQYPTLDLYVNTQIWIISVAVTVSKQDDHMTTFLQLTAARITHRQREGGKPADHHVDRAQVCLKQLWGKRTGV